MPQLSMEIGTLEVSIPERTEHVLAGYFTFLEPNGLQVRDKFTVFTCSNPQDDPIRKSFRLEDLNVQFAIEYQALLGQGCKSISYEDVKPNPFF